MRRPRCLHPVRPYRRPGTDPDEAPVCWRPLGHAGTRHASRAAWLRARARKRPPGPRRWRNVIPCPSAAAYKRHIRHRELPCEGDLAAVAACSAASRAARRTTGMSDPGDTDTP